MTGPPAKRLDTGAYTFVMATGIVSVAASTQRLFALSDPLFVLAAAAWVAVTLVLLARAARGDWRRPQLTSFALVAATAVVGTRFSLAGRQVFALGLWALAIAAWVALLAARPRGGRPDGGRLLLVVGTESLAVLAAFLAPRVNDELVIPAVGWWLLGLACYPVVIAGIAAELRRRPRFGPDLWVVMGALAIATVAGTELLLAARTTDELVSVRGALSNADLATWALASTLVLPLAVADVRHRGAWRDRLAAGASSFRWACTQWRRTSSRGLCRSPRPRPWRRRSSPRRPSPGR